MPVGEKLPEDRVGVFGGGVVYILDHHPLPLVFALVYLIDRRKFPDTEAAMAYLEELDKQQSWKSSQEKA